MWFRPSRVICTRVFTTYFLCLVQFVLVLFLSSCVQSHRSSSYVSSVINTVEITNNTVTWLDEAKRADIPFPIPSVPIPQRNWADGDTVVLGCRTSLSADEVTLFYCREMERLGWLCIKRFSGYEELLSFEKPSRICIVSIRSIRDKTDIMVFTGYRECDSVSMSSSHNASFNS